MSRSAPLVVSSGAEHRDRCALGRQGDPLPSRGDHVDLEGGQRQVTKLERGHPQLDLRLGHLPGVVQYGLNDALVQQLE